MGAADQGFAAMQSTLVAALGAERVVGGDGDPVGVHRDAAARHAGIACWRPAWRATAFAVNALAALLVIVPLRRAARAGAAPAERGSAVAAGRDVGCRRVGGEMFVRIDFQNCETAGIVTITVFGSRLTVALDFRK